MGTFSARGERVSSAKACHRALKPRSLRVMTPAGTTKKRILALDGGGIRGFFTLQILAEIERQLREHLRNPGLVLADHFDMIAGTSTGAIIGSFLSWGMPVAEVQRHYAEQAPGMFRWMASPLWLIARYDSSRLAEFLKALFVEADGTPATLGSKRLRNVLMVVVRNASTGSAWPVTNNPAARFASENLPLPLWQLVRASTAAPTFFRPEIVHLPDGSPHTFFDGGTTTYNNPALIAALTATLPCYSLEWPTGTDKLQLVSVGTGRRRRRLDNPDQIWLLHLASMPMGYLEATGWQQDMICRVLGECVHGEALDMEVGDLTASGLFAPAEKKFGYVRYDHLIAETDIAEIESEHGRWEMTNVRLIPVLTRLGREYAAKNVKVGHLL